MPNEFPNSTAAPVKPAMLTRAQLDERILASEFKERVIASIQDLDVTDFQIWRTSGASQIRTQLKNRAVLAVLRVFDDFIYQGCQDQDQAPENEDTPF